VLSRIFVTGAGGFVGGHLVNALSCRPDTLVTGLLGVGDQYRPAADRLVESDINDLDRCTAAMAEADCVIHLAGPSSVAASFSDPALFAQVHVGGTATVMRVAQSLGVRRRILISSAEVYGAPEISPVDETFACKPISPYGAAKLGAEWMARAIARADQADLTIVRPFSLYGPRMRENSVLGIILKSVRLRQSVELEDLRPVRDYLHIDDLVSLVTMLAEGDGAPQIVNACSGHGLSVGELAGCALAQAGSSDSLSQSASSPRPTDVNELVGSNVLANEVLGWHPTIDINSGIAGMLAS
jgi:UDP-glucose 4-epimerase